MNFTDDILGIDALMLKANRLLAEYNKKRESFFNKSRAFYNSSVKSTYITEENLIELLCELDEIKHAYNTVCEELERLGLKITFSGCGFREGNELEFRSLDLLHIV